jgi:hypothetical protein
VISGRPAPEAGSELFCVAGPVARARFPAAILFPTSVVIVVSDLRERVTVRIGS